MVNALKINVLGLLRLRAEHMQPIIESITEDRIPAQILPQQAVAAFRSSSRAGQETVDNYNQQ